MKLNTVLDLPQSVLLPMVNVDQAPPPVSTEVQSLSASLVVDNNNCACTEVHFLTCISPFLLLLLLLLMLSIHVSYVMFVDAVKPFF